jgi:hypothetical protein
MFGESPNDWETLVNKCMFSSSNLPKQVWESKKDTGAVNVLKHSEMNADKALHHSANVDQEFGAVGETKSEFSKFKFLHIQIYLYVNGLK